MEEEIMKIIFMLNLAHTPSKHTEISREWDELTRDVYEIYCNIKFNHGMESINNNFRVEQGKMIGWMKREGERMETEPRLWSKPHTRALSIACSDVLGTMESETSTGAVLSLRTCSRST